MDRSTQRPAHTRQLSGVVAVLAAVVVLILIAIGVARHPASLQTPGSRYLSIDVALLFSYGIAGIWVCFQAIAVSNAAVRVGSVVGGFLAAVLVANHAIELFVPARNFALVLCPVLLTLVLMGSAGSAAWQRSGSLAQAALAGVWCAMVGALLGLSAILLLIFIFPERAELPLREAFAASGMSDAAAFLMRNSLEAASEVLLRMPVFALFLSLVGGLASACITKLPRSVILPGASIALLGLTIGVTALWHAESLDRSARPPFVVFGVVLTGLALAATHPIFAALRSPRRGLARHA